MLLLEKTLYKLKEAKDGEGNTTNMYKHVEKILELSVGYILFSKFDQGILVDEVKNFFSLIHFN